MKRHNNGIGEIEIRKMAIAGLRRLIPSIMSMKGWVSPQLVTDRVPYLRVFGT
jgi:hypothetical protein